MVDSPAYPCQFVLVVNDEAVLKAEWRGDRTKALRVQRQPTLQALKRVQDEHRHHTERQK